jgi:YD repeat-containing protein
LNDPAKVLLDPNTLSFEQIYNAVGDLLTETSPDGTVTKRSYSKSGLLATIDLKLPDGKSKPVIQRIEYNASNQRTRVVFANNSSSVYTYEGTTQRLITLKNTRLVTSGENPLLQNITYVYDPVGNITRLRDLSRDTIFYNNQKVVPLSDYTYDILYRLSAANGYQHPGILANTYQNNVVNNDFKQSKFSVAPLIMTNWKTIVKAIPTIIPET